MVTIIVLITVFTVFTFVTMVCILTISDVLYKGLLCAFRPIGLIPLLLFRVLYIAHLFCWESSRTMK